MPTLVCAGLKPGDAMSFMEDLWLHFELDDVRIGDARADYADSAALAGLQPAFMWSGLPRFAMHDHKEASLAASVVSTPGSGHLRSATLCF